MTIASSSLGQKLTQLGQRVLLKPQRAWRDKAFEIIEDLINVSYSSDLHNFEPTYMEIFACEATGSQTINEDVPQKLTQFVNIGNNDGVNFTPASVTIESGSITIPLSGTYSVDFHVAYTTNIGSANYWKLRAFQNEESIPGMCTRTTQGTNQDQYSANFCGIHGFDEGDLITIEVSGSGGNDSDFDVHHGALIIKRIQ